ncbi:MAG: hypothetical protein IPG94_15670 [Kineosporiaceae bacterium]|nr:hypothetical protein [Kineosporiaceae bacterium]
MQFVFGALAVMAVVMLIFYALWIALVLFFRLLSYLIFYYAVVLAVGALAGALVGLWVPWTVLAGRAHTVPRLLTPDDVIAGTALRGRPRGPAKHFGWDHAWPSYLPYQAEYDARAVAAETRLWLHRAWGLVSGTRPMHWATLVSAVRGRDIALAAPAAPTAARYLFLAVPFAGFSIGLVASVAVWFLLMGAVGALLSLGRALMLWVHRLRDRVSLRRDRASMICVECFTESSVPSYACSNASCGVIHRDMRPGPLGVVGRRCACGELLPTTVSSASRSLAIRCPSCDAEQSAGAGTRQTVMLPIIGEVAAGKTRLLVAASVGLAMRLTRTGGSLTPLNDEAEAFLSDAEALVVDRRNTVKTPDAIPRGVALLAQGSGPRPVELQLLDAAGELFQNWDTTARLRYFDNARSMLFVMDPLAIPAVQREFRRSTHQGQLLVAEGRAEEAYAAVVDRLRQEGVPTDKRTLVVVLPKADVLTRLGVGRDLRDADSEGIRSWLIGVDQDLLVRRLERDFLTVRYFVVDSMNTTDVDHPLHPVQPLLCAIEQGGAQLIPEPKEAAS